MREKLLPINFSQQILIKKEYSHPNYNISLIYTYIHKRVKMDYQKELILFSFNKQFQFFAE